MGRSEDGVTDLEQVFSHVACVKDTLVVFDCVLQLGAAVLINCDACLTDRGKSDSTDQWRSLRLNASNMKCKSALTCVK